MLLIEEKQRRRERGEEMSLYRANWLEGLVVKGQISELHGVSKVEASEYNKTSLPPA